MSGTQKIEMQTVMPGCGERLLDFEETQTRAGGLSSVIIVRAVWQFGSQSVAECTH